MCSHPTHGDNNDFLAGVPNAPAPKFTARDVLTYLYAEAVEWKEDTDGDCEDGITRIFVTHHICIKDSLLDELLDMAGIKKMQYDETPLEALKRANEEDMAPIASDASSDRASDVSEPVTPSPPKDGGGHG